MIFYDLRKFVRSNDYSSIIEHVAKDSKPNDPSEISYLTREAVKVTKNGREPHAVNALMKTGFRFVALDSWNKNNWPTCALTDIYNFASSAKSRKLEALKLLHTVFNYELPQTQQVGNKIIPITSSEMMRLKRLIELELKINRHELKREYGIKYLSPKFLFPALVFALFQFSKTALA